MKKQEVKALKQKIADEEHHRKMEQLQRMYANLEDTLTSFTDKERGTIIQNADFRLKFSKLCLALDIDPLLSWLRSEARDLRRVDLLLQPIGG